MQRWEYRLFTNRDVPNDGFLQAAGRASLTRALNDLGQEGWELVAADFRDEALESLAFTAVFKRPLQG
jgi:hypothetical protein